MMRCSVIVLAAVAVSVAFADGPPGDRELIEQAAAQRQPAQPSRLPDVPAPPSAAPADDLSQAERAARIEANLALAKLDLVLGRKLLRAGAHQPAARKAHHALVLLRQLPPEVDAIEYELQAEGILARAARAGVNVEALARDAADEVTLLEGDAELDRQTQAAARIARQYTGPARSDADTSGDARALRQRTLRRQASTDRYGYRPGRVIVNVDAILAGDNQRTYYQGALREAYKTSEVRLLVEADEARVVPESIVSYPADWRERVRKRQKWADGVVARSASWHDRDGREWYVAIYDIHDLIYVPPDFDSLWPRSTREALRNARDRREFWDHAYLFFGRGHDAAETIPLLRYFGGVDPIAARGPKYSLERQQQIVDMIRAFTGARVEDPVVLPLAPR